tara:strand:- start:78 stop:284 length:207 start_codon:yes stop_codon:yes gene_type:complete
MKSSLSSIKQKIISRYKFEDTKSNHIKKADINVLLNRVKFDRKNEIKKKILFTTATSFGVVLFSFLIF